MIFIGYNRNSLPISIVSAKSEESARAYWQGSDQLPDTVVEFDMAKDRDNEELGYVTPILKTKEISSNDFRHLSDRNLILVSKK